MAGAGGGEGGGDRIQEKEWEEEESIRGKNAISPLFSLLNRLQPVRGVLWPNFTEPECLLVSVRQQRIITLDVQQTIISFIYIHASSTGMGQGHTASSHASRQAEMIRMHYWPRSFC